MTDRTFEASRYLRNLRGRDYLEVKWRLVWLRTDHPDATIETEMVKQTPPNPRGEPGSAIFKARVAIPGAGEATGWGSETSNDFKEYIEKAETKALGRALSALGYGTQFCEDFSFVDSEPERTEQTPGSPRQANARAKEAIESPAPAGSVSKPASEPQLKAIFALGRDHFALDEDGVEAKARTRFGLPTTELSRRQASEFIQELKSGSLAA